MHVIGRAAHDALTEADCKIEEVGDISLEQNLKRGSLCISFSKGSRIVDRHSTHLAFEMRILLATGVCLVSRMERGAFGFYDDLSSDGISVDADWVPEWLAFTNRSLRDLKDLELYQLAVGINTMVREILEILNAGLTPPEDLTHHCHRHSAMLKIRMAGHAARLAEATDALNKLNKAVANI